MVRIIKWVYLDLYRIGEDIKKQYDSMKLAFISSGVVGIIAYVYVMVNGIHNPDDLLCTPSGIGGTLELGRWLLDKIYVFRHWWASGQYYNSCSYNILLAIVLVSLSNAVSVLLFSLKDKKMICLFSAITVLWPAIGALVVFNFTVLPYSYALLLAVVGVFIGTRRSILGYILGGLMISRSLGGYQAYFGYAATLVILLLISELILGSHKNYKASLIGGIRYLLLLVEGYIFYRVQLYYYLQMKGTELSNYQGLDQMGNVKLDTLPEIVRTVYHNMILVLHDNYMCVSMTNVIQKMILLSYIASIVLVVISVKRLEYVSLKIMFVIYIVLTPLAFDSIEIMAPGAWKYSLQSLSMVGIFYLPIILLDHVKSDDSSLLLNNAVSRDWVNASVLIPRIIYSLVIISISIASLNFYYISNINYTSLKYKLDEIENYYQTVYNQIVCTEEYSNDKEIVFVGETFSNVPKLNLWELGKNQRFDATYIDVNSYSKVNFMKIYIGEAFRSINEEESGRYKDIIAEMSVYPNSGSIKCVDNLVLVRITE